MSSSGLDLTGLTELQLSNIYEEHHSIDPEYWYNRTHPDLYRIPVCGYPSIQGCSNKMLFCSLVPSAPLPIPWRYEAAMLPQLKLEQRVLEWQCFSWWEICIEYQKVRKHRVYRWGILKVHTSLWTKLILESVNCFWLFSFCTTTEL